MAAEIPTTCGRHPERSAPSSGSQRGSDRGVEDADVVTGGPQGARDAGEAEGRKADQAVDRVAARGVEQEDPHDAASAPRPAASERRPAQDEATLRPSRIMSWIQPYSKRPFLPASTRLEKAPR